MEALTKDIKDAVFSAATSIFLTESVLLQTPAGNKYRLGIQISRGPVCVPGVATPMRVLRVQRIGFAGNAHMSEEEAEMALFEFVCAGGKTIVPKDGARPVWDALKTVVPFQLPRSAGVCSALEVQCVHSAALIRWLEDEHGFKQSDEGEKQFWGPPRDLFWTPLAQPV